jgi:hypothetical protein
MKNKTIKAKEKKINWVGTYQWFKLTQTHIDRLEEYKAWMNFGTTGGGYPADKAVITKLQNHIKLAYLYPNNNTDLKKGIWADFITDNQAKLLNELEFWYHNIIGDLDLSDAKVRACSEFMYRWSDSVAPTYSIDLKKKGNNVHYQIGKYITKNQYNEFIEYSKQLIKK